MRTVSFSAADLYVLIFILLLLMGFLHPLLPWHSDLGMRMRTCFAESDHRTMSGCRVVSVMWGRNVTGSVFMEIFLVLVCFTRNRVERGREDTAKGCRLGVEPARAVAPLYMGCLLGPLCL